MEIVRLERNRLGEASEVLARAFFDDPAWVWLIPDPAKRAQLLPWLFRIGFESTNADVYSTAGAIQGAVPVAGARTADDARRDRRCARSSPCRCASVARPARFSPTAAPSSCCAPRRRRSRTGTSPGSASNPAAQRRGIGAALLGPGIDAAARDRVPAVLLTNNEVNLAFYEANGFRVVKEGSTPKDGPHAWAMVRDP